MNFGLDFYNKTLQKGKYIIEVTATWASGAVKDYSIVILSESKIKITDSKGATSTPTFHDFNNKNLKPLVP